MSEQADRLALLFEKIKRYLNVRIELLELTIAERGAQVLAKLIANGILLLFAACALLFINLAAGFALGAWLENIALGFLLVAAFYVLLIIIIVIFKRKYIEKPLVDIIIRAFFNNNENEKNG